MITAMIHHHFVLAKHTHNVDDKWQRKNNRTQRSKVDLGLQELLFIHTPDPQFSHCTVRLKPNCARDYENPCCNSQRTRRKRKEMCLFDSLLLLLLLILLDGFLARQLGMLVKVLNEPAAQLSLKRPAKLSSEQYSYLQLLSVQGTHTTPPVNTAQALWCRCFSNIAHPVLQVELSLNDWEACLAKLGSCWCQERSSVHQVTCSNSSSSSSSKGTVVSEGTIEHMDY
jgi:hypothetical protein